MGFPLNCAERDRYEYFPLFAESEVRHGDPLTASPESRDATADGISSFAWAPIAARRRRGDRLRKYIKRYA